jgi:hypothetical protein
MKHTVLAILGALVVFGPVVYAHHSHPDFLLDQDATVEESSRVFGSRARMF